MIFEINKISIGCQDEKVAADPFLGKLKIEKVRRNDKLYPLRFFRTIEINTLEELLNLIKEVDCEIIIRKKDPKSLYQEIEIYDDYRE